MSEFRRTFSAMLQGIALGWVVVIVGIIIPFAGLYALARIVKEIFFS